MAVTNPLITAITATRRMSTQNCSVMQRHDSTLVVAMQVAAGHLSRDELSAVVLGGSFCKVFGMSLFAGLASALDTLCGQVGPDSFP